MPDGATQQAHRLHDVWVIFLWCGAFVYAVTAGLIAWSVLRWPRRNASHYPKQFSENKRIEIIYTVLPLLMVIGLFVVTDRAEQYVEMLSPRPALTVNVTGFRWSWRFDYPNNGVSIQGTPANPPQLTLPLGATTRIILTSADVNHAFWIPAFLFKRDAIPGVVNQFDLTPDKVGITRGACAEFCGLDHAFMTFTVNVLPPDRFANWLRTAHRTAFLETERR